MKLSSRVWEYALLVCLIFGMSSAVPYLCAQAPQETPGPRLVKYSATLTDSLNRPLNGMMGVTFAIYAQREGGTPLWLETQNVRLEAEGRYTVLLGATTKEGLPLDLFTTGESRWLGVQVNLPGEVEQPRVLLVSVPYALKAADAETVGGLPASAFVQVQGGPPSSSSTRTNVIDSTTVLSQLLQVNGTGTPDRLAKFTTTTDIGDSLLLESGGRISVGGGMDFSSDFSFVGNAEPAATGRVQMFDRAWQGFVIRGLNVIFETLQGTPAVPTEALRITQTGNIGIGTSNPSERVEVEGKIKATQFMGDGSQLSGVAALSATNAFSGQGMFSAAPTGSGVNQGSLFVNPAAAAAGSTVLGLAVGGTQRFIVDAEGDVTVAGNLTAASLSEISARRWKTNIQPLTGAIGKIERLRGVSFDMRIGGKHDIGFIAEEVGEVVPEVVARGEDGEAKSVNYSRLTALLVEAVKEQQAQIRELQSEIQLLKAKLKGEEQAAPVK